MRGARLRVMTFNVRYGTAADGPNAWPFRRHAAIEVVRRFAPHVVGLQEALAFQIEELLQEMPTYAAIGVGRDDGIREGEHTAIIYDRSALTVAASGTFWFSPEPDVPGSRHEGCFHPRICTWARFEEGFALYNLHLDNESGSSRELSVAQLVSTIDKGVPTIVTGDFNAGEQGPCIEAMRSAGFADSYRILHPNGPAPTYHGFGTGGNPDKIDYIWLDGAWSAEEAGIVQDIIDGAWPSDHYPVTATLSGKRGGVSRVEGEPRAELACVGVSVLERSEGSDTGVVCL